MGINKGWKNNKYVSEKKQGLKEKLKAMREIRSTNRVYIRGLLVHTFGQNTRGLVQPGLPYKPDGHTHTHTRTSDSPHPRLLTHMCAHTVLRPPQVSQTWNAVATHKHDTGIFLSIEDAGKTEDVCGLHEETADDGRPQRSLRGTNACPRESCGGSHQSKYRWTGKMLAHTYESVWSYLNM